MNYKQITYLIKKTRHKQIITNQLHTNSIPITHQFTYPTNNKNIHIANIHLLHILTTYIPITNHLLLKKTRLITIRRRVLLLKKTRLITIRRRVLLLKKTRLITIRRRVLLLKKTRLITIRRRVLLLKKTRLT